MRARVRGRSDGRTVGQTDGRTDGRSDETGIRAVRECVWLGRLCSTSAAGQCHRLRALGATPRQLPPELLCMESHEQLEAWRMAHRLTLEVYQATDRWPRSERYELTTQARRAAISVPANIAEG